MNLPELGPISEFIRIPGVFYNSVTNAPFDKCLFCNKYLLASGVTYIIEKAFRNYKEVKKQDIIFEYALCCKCYNLFYNSFSE